VRHKTGDLPGGSLGSGATGVGRAMTRFLPTVSVASTSSSTEGLASLLGQTDAVRRPVTLCESGFPWMVMLRRGGGKDDG
jgi:hypothetical protein